MEFRAVGSRCAVDLRTVEHIDTPERILALLKRHGFHRVAVTPVSVARELVGKARYRRGACLSEAPAVFDCSSFTKWVYGQCGIWLPRRSIQQSLVGVAVRRSSIRSGDLVFVSGRRNYFLRDPKRGIGHVGIATGEGTVVHAASPRPGIVESPMSRFTHNGRILRGIRRVIPVRAMMATFSTPHQWEIESDDDLRWVLLQLRG